VGGKYVGPGVVMTSRKEGVLVVCRVVVVVIFRVVVVVIGRDVVVVASSHLGLSAPFVQQYFPANIK